MSQTGDHNQVDRMITGIDNPEEIDLNSVPDKDDSKALLWKDAYKELVAMIVENPIIAYRFFTWYRKYHILGHPKFGRLFIRLGRYLRPDNILDDLLNRFDEKGDLIRGK